MKSVVLKKISINHLVSLFTVALFSVAGNAQQIRYFAGFGIGKGGMEQVRQYQFAPGLFVNEMHYGGAVHVFAGADKYNCIKKYTPGMSVGYFILPFDVKYFGTPEGKETGYVHFDLNSDYGSRYFYNLKYFTLVFRNQYKLFQNRKIVINTEGNLGLRKLQKSAYTPANIATELSSLPEDESIFYTNFKSYAYIEAGLNVRILRKRLGITARFNHNITSLHKNGHFRSMKILEFGLNYNFANTNLLRRQYTQSDNIHSKIIRETDGIVFGAGLTLRTGGKITTTGSQIISNAFGTSTLTLSGDYSYGMDFPFLPFIYASKQIMEKINAEASIGYRSAYYSMVRTKDTSITGDLGVQEEYAQNLLLTGNVSYDIYQKSFHQFQLIAGISLWKQLASEGNPVKSHLNLIVGPGYRAGNLSLRLNFYTNISKIKVDESLIGGNLKLKRFTYSEISVGYDIFRKMVSKKRVAK